MMKKPVLRVKMPFDWLGNFLIWTFSVIESYLNICKSHLEVYIVTKEESVINNESFSKFKACLWCNLNGFSVSVDILCKQALQC